MKNPKTMNSKYARYCEHLARHADLSGALGVLSWDKEVNMPPRGAPFRTRQLATLEGLAHQTFTDPEFQRLVQDLLADDSLDAFQKRNVELTWRDLQRIARLDQDFVEERSRLVSLAYFSWLEARDLNDYARFQPALQRLVELKRREAELLGYEDHPYDALLEEFEPGLRVRFLEPLFERVKGELRPFAQALRSSPQPQNDFLYQPYPRHKQWDLGLKLLRAIGYDFDAGRQDLSPHPFTISFSPEDVRVTTRIDENNLAEMVWSCIHEGGHALYEQGLPPEHYGLPAAAAASLGIHESQSRLWENHVGRSRPFWEKFYPLLQETFPENLQGVSLDTFYRGINRVEPSLIRTESDEIHYHFHVLIRYELEKQLLEGSLQTQDLRDAWNERYTEYLGIAIPDDNRGVLQDIHWAHGSFGYFPTYSLGSFYAAQFFAAAERALPDLEDQIRQGRFAPLLEWLRASIHRHGRIHDPGELCRRVTGEELNFDYFLEYARKKFGAIYAGEAGVHASS